MDYQLIINISDIVSSAAFILALAISWYYILAIFLAFRKQKRAPHSDKKTRFAVIVPARNESRVIRKNLESLKKQTYDKNYYDVWVIIETKDDPTYLICQKMGVKCFIRPEIGDRRTKGFAIQDLHNYFMANDIQYDAYMIFDADNIVSSRYLELMNDLRQTGVQIGLGYRNFTNASQNWLTCSTAVFFTYMMSFTANMRSRAFRKTTLCGTGYYVDVQVIKDAGGWRFTGMTEDMQLTAYSYYHDVKCRYYPIMDFYDEMASSMKEAHNQLVRWVWGFLSIGRKNLKEPKEVDYHTLKKGRRFWCRFEYSVSFVPFVVVMALILLLFLANLAVCIHSLFFAPELSGQFFGFAMIMFAIFYGTSAIIASIVIICDNKKLKFNFATIVWAVLTYALFWLEAVNAMIDGFFHPKKRTIWKETKHTGTITNKKIQGK